MQPRKKREIIIEFERVQLVRRKALTHQFFCGRCGDDVDFVTLGEATALFSTPAENLLRFIQSNNIHFETGSESEVMVCLVSLLTAMKSRTALANIKMLSE